ncbi:diguanylate cyclase [Agarivorans sp. JK6]|uniref:sensor domain-containing diguanylate cyclase n=1 Tax=Agarivorans sp. JK6 TaxID=2997426 RepID=UPI0038735CF2
MNSRFLKNNISWQKKAGFWALLVTLLFAAVLSHRYQTIKHQIVEEVELSFGGFKTANKHLISLLSQRLSLLTRTLGLLNYVNDESELTLVTLATEWQRIARDVNLEGNFYYVHRDGRVDLALNQSKEGHTLEWSSGINPIIKNYFKGLSWRDEGVISTKVIYDKSNQQTYYVLYIPVFDKWSKLVGWMVNEYDQQAINQTVHFVGRPMLVERAVIVTSDDIVIEGDFSQDTTKKLLNLVGKLDYSSLSDYFDDKPYRDAASPYDVGSGLMFTSVLDEYEDSNPNTAFLYISYKDLATDSRHWLIFIAVVYLVSIVGCFFAAYLTEMIRREKAVVEELNALREAAFEGEFSQVIINPTGKVMQANQYLAKKVGVDAEQMIGTKLTDFGQSDPGFDEVLKIAAEEGSWLGEVSILGNNGLNTIQQMTVTAVYWQGKLHNFVCSSIDISAQKTLEDKLMQLANTDPLTGAANRRHFEDSVFLEQSRSDRNGSRFSILMIDVDHFKQLNDQYGHDTGDLCLIRLVETITKLKRETDLLARWGGEEFIMLLPETDLTQAINLAERLRLAFEQDKAVPSFTCSFGITQSEKDCSFAKLYKQADKALYTAKNNGRNQVVEYASMMEMD